MKMRKRFLIYLLIAGILMGNSMSVSATENDDALIEAIEAENEEQKETEEVSKEKEEHIITGFEELGEDESCLILDEKLSLDEVLKALPQTLSVELDGEKTAEIEVVWKCVDDYEETEYDYYEFLPFWDEDVYLLSNTLDEYWDVPCVMVIVPLPITEEEQAWIDEAKEVLHELLEEESVQALVYLCEKYEMKEQPDADSDTVVVLSTGTTVQIVDMHVDENRKIWYQVSCDFETKTYTGYIEKENLAYSHEAFLNWEAEYLSAYMAQAATYALSYADVEQFPESYRDSLLALKRKHPNWVFVKQNTNLNWESVIAAQNSKTRSLISVTMGVAYRTKYHSPGWYYASEKAISYYMDPRNFLDDTHIFMFEQLTFNSSYHTQSAVQSILDGTFMSGNLPDEDMSYAKAFYQVGASLGVSPFHLASRVYQEQGKGTSSMISGEYEDYEGYYNYFNIGATAEKTSDETIIAGLSYAKEKGWDSAYKSLKGGASILAANYILKGQDTLYLQKFNVDGRYHGLYEHQYMQNIMAPYTESPKIKKAYANTGSLENAFVFKIPVYNKMPEEACPVPTLSATPSPTKSPTPTATTAPTETPTKSPTTAPTETPTKEPTKSPTVVPTETPAKEPTKSPTTAPTETPTKAPTKSPTTAPTEAPTKSPTVAPTETPTQTPTVSPTKTPTATQVPTAKATQAPTETPDDTKKNTEEEQEIANQLVQVMPQPTKTPESTVAPTQTPEAVTTGDVAQQTEGNTVVQQTPQKTQTPAAEDTQKANEAIVLDMSDNTKIYAQTLEKIKENDTKIELTMNDTVTWSIDGGSIVSDSLEDIDFKVTVGDSQIPEEKKSELTEGEEKVVELSLAHDGEFGFDAVLTVDLNSVEALPGQYANLFYYNEANEQFEFMCAAPVNEDGKAAFTFKHASDYVIIVNEKTLDTLTEEIETQKQQLAEEMQAQKKAEIERQEAPTEEPVKAVGIISGILAASVLIAISILLIYRKKK